MNSKFNTLSSQISNRLYKTMLAAWLILAILVAIGLLSFYHVNQSYSSVLVQADALQSSAMDLNVAIVSEMLSTRAYLITGREEAITQRQLSHQDIERNIKNFDQLLASNSNFNIPSLSMLSDLHQKYDATAAQLIALRRSGRTQDAIQLFDQQSDPLVAAMQSASHNMQNEVLQGLEVITQNYNSFSQIVILLVASVFLIGTGVLAIILLQQIAPSLRTLDYFENMLRNAVETRIYAPINAPADKGNGDASHLFEAYNQLTARLIESSGAILKYVSFLHHEINSLLASVVGYGSMLADPELRPYDADSEEYGKIIVQQARRITFLVEDFSLGAKIEGNQYHPVLMPTNLTPLITSLVHEMGEESHRDILLTGASHPILLLADALSLEKALRKIIENGLKFSTPDTPVHVMVDTSTAPNNVQIHIQDQGTGIAASDLPLLYHPFSRVMSETTKRIPGNGMGLYLADAIIRAHHGTIGLQSQPGTGSTFTIALPVKE